MFEFGHCTHPGLRRRFNEDSYGIDAASGLFVVVDGMGGPGYGEAIAALAREEALRAARQGMRLDQALRCAAAVVEQWLASHPAAHPAGVAAALLRLHETDFEIAWAGDCTVLLGGSDPARVASAAVLPAPADDACESAATARLGLLPARPIAIGLRMGRLRCPASILLCSDGAIEATTVAGRQRALTDHNLGAQEAVEILLLEALAQQARDNLTAILVRLRR